MSHKIYLAIIVLVVLVGASVAAFYMLQPSQEDTPSTSTVKAGVKVGDTFTYKMVGIADLHTSDVEIPENFMDVNRTDFYRVEITSVDLPIISYTVTWQFENGTKYSDNGMINIENGANTGEFWGIYAANLTEGSLVRPGDSKGATINATETRQYLNGERQTNILRMQGELYDVTDETLSKSCFAYTYVDFDSQTGILVALKDMKIYNYPEIILTVEWTLVDSNVLQVPQQ
ncbi:MAG: hypothetical protein FWG55_08445 [Candidatus Bathyarchaeota archaeon]|nr:hypothetical protein [Candidatus Termiticorpusculum sp.]